MTSQIKKTRCGWANHPLELQYHDEEWGRPVHDDRELFERLMLECMQAGLSWLTILKKREAMRAAFDSFDPQKIAGYKEDKINSLLQNPGIIRNRLKVQAAVANAHAYFRVKEQYGTLDAFLWRYVDGQPIMGNRQKLSDVPASTPLAEQISKDMKKLGFKFVGPTIIYAFMQSIGMVNDHVLDCFTWENS
ncbi:DNA-3-methyladenine glycosylase I [Christensenellaceae bacterium OttesenSCG-928-K19]|nr:DNA-3-methyladenine glycosylase I [Christensenellaceae bacterium OttesenSCG-928-K19]